MSTCRMWQPVSPPATAVTGTRRRGTGWRCRGRRDEPRPPAPAPAARRRRRGRRRRTCRAPGRRRPGPRGRGPARRPAPSIRPTTAARVNRRGPGRPAGPGSPRRPLAGSAADLGQQPPGVVEPAGQRAVDHRRNRTGGEHADRAGGPQHLGDRRHGVRRGVNVLQHAVAEHQIRARLAGHHREVRDVSLDHAERDVHLGGPAFGGGERVGAGIDHRHVVAQAGQRHGEPAGPAAGVEDVEPGPAGLRRERGDHRPEDVADDRGARVVVPAPGPARRTAAPRPGGAPAAPVPSSAPGARRSPATANLPVPRSVTNVVPPTDIPGPAGSPARPRVRAAAA